MEVLTRERQIEIEIAAVELLQDFGLTNFSVSITRVAKALDIKLVPYSSLPEDEKKLAFAASDDAFHARTADFMDVRIVFDDTNGSLFLRSRFSGGHEVGHVVLEHQEDTPNREREADYFAGYLLAPHPLVLNRPAGYSISEVFGVSEKCAEFAFDQAEIRKAEGGPWLPHEQWLLDNIVWKGGGLLARA